MTGSSVVCFDAHNRERVEDKHCVCKPSNPGFDGDAYGNSEFVRIRYLRYSNIRVTYGSVRHVWTATLGFSYDSKDSPTEVVQQILIKVSQTRYILSPLGIFWEAMATRRSYVNHLIWNLGASRKETIVSMFLCLTGCKPSLLTTRIESTAKPRGGVGTSTCSGTLVP